MHQSTFVRLAWDQNPGLATVPVKTLERIQSKVRLAFVFVGTMAIEAVVGEDSSYIAIELHRARAGRFRRWGHRILPMARRVNAETKEGNRSGHPSRGSGR